MPPSERLGEYLRRGSSLAPALLAVDDLGCPIYWREVRFLSPNPLVVGGRVSAGLYRSAQVRLGGGTSGSNPLCSSDESIANPTAVALAGNIIIDDPLKPDEAFSDARRQGCNEWYDHTLYSRQNDKRCGAIIIMQRLHEDDLVGNFDHKTPRSAQPSRGEVCFMLTDRYRLALSTTSTAARDDYVLATDRALTFYPGAAEAYDRAITADPGFALAHAGKAQVLMRQGDIAAAHGALAAAKDVSAGLSEREASHIEFFDLVFAGRTEAAIAALYPHLTAWPCDALVVASPRTPTE